MELMNVETWWWPLVLAAIGGVVGTAVGYTFVVIRETFRWVRAWRRVWAWQMAWAFRYLPRGSEARSEWCAVRAEKRERRATAAAVAGAKSNKELAEREAGLEELLRARTEPVPATAGDEPVDSSAPQPIPPPSPPPPTAPPVRRRGSVHSSAPSV